MAGWCFRFTDIQSFALHFQPETDGYIAVVLPKLTEVESIYNGLLSSDEYEKILEKRYQEKNGK